MDSRFIRKVSVIVPAYNAEQYIESCLDSLIRQNCKNLEIVIIDDGSEDSTGIICDMYQQCYKNFIKVGHCHHGGVCRARLSGVQKASGEYVVFVDADDWVENDYISSMLFHMEEADIVAAGIAREVEDTAEKAFYEFNGMPSGKYEEIPDRQKLYGKMLYSEEPYRFGVLPYICNKMFRRDILQLILEKSDKRIFDGEDASVVYRYLLISQKIVLTDECKYHYLYHKGTASLTDRKDAYLNASYLYQELYECFTQSVFNTILLEQLDYYMRRMVWKKDPAAYLQVNSFLFPYDKVKQGSDIVLYGMGKVGKAFYQQIVQTQYCGIIAWADQKPQIPEIVENVPGILPDEIKEYCFDYLVIAIQNRITACEIAETLSFAGIDRKKVIIPDL